MSFDKSLYNNYFDAYKKNYDNKELTDEDKGKYDYKQFEIIDKKKTIRMDWRKNKTEMQKPLWFKINKKEFDELTENI